MHDYITMWTEGEKGHRTWKVINGFGMEVRVERHSDNRCREIRRNHTVPSRSVFKGPMIVFMFGESIHHALNSESSSSIVCFGTSAMVGSLLDRPQTRQATVAGLGGRRWYNVFRKRWNLRGGWSLRDWYRLKPASHKLTGDVHGETA